MAIAHPHFITRNLQGSLAKTLVFKQYGRKTVVTAYPDMSQVKPSILQVQKRSRFAAAVAYAKGIIQDASLKEQYKQKVKPGQSVYHYALREYLAAKSDETTQQG